VQLSSHLLIAHSKKIRTAAMCSGRDDIMASSSLDGTLALWRFTPRSDVVMPEELARLRPEDLDGARLPESLVFDPSGEVLLAGLSQTAPDRGKQVAIVKLPSARQARSLSCSPPFRLF
jgi:hypothetical protein